MSFLDKLGSEVSIFEGGQQLQIIGNKGDIFSIQTDVTNLDDTYILCKVIPTIFCGYVPPVHYLMKSVKKTLLFQNRLLLLHCDKNEDDVQACHLWNNVGHITRMSRLRHGQVFSPD